MKKAKWLFVLLLVLLFVFSLAACGPSGDGDDNDGGGDDPAVTEYNVSFYTNYPEASASSQSATVRKTIDGYLDATFIPSYMGYTFNGWWNSSGVIDGRFALTTRFDTSKKVTKEGLSLYADWIEVKTQQGQLDAPSVSVDGNRFSWQSVQNCTGYQVRYILSGAGEAQVEDLTAGETHWDFPYDIGGGNYRVSIRATGNGTVTANSAYCVRSYKLDYLNNPENLTVNSAFNKLTWNGVQYATHYAVKLDGNLIKDDITGMSCDLPEMDAGNHTMRVEVYRAGEAEAYSSVTVEKFTLKIPENVEAAYNEDYELVLTWDAVFGANAYDITISGEALPRVSSTEITVTSVILAAVSPSAEKVIEIRAVDTLTDRLPSNKARVEYFTIEYELNGGDFDDDIRPSICIYGYEFELPSASKEDLIFKGWCIDGGLAGEAYSEYTLTEENAADGVKFYALFNPSVRLSRNLTEAGTVTGAGNFRIGESVTVTAVTNPNYTWLGWYYDGVLFDEEEICTFEMLTEDMLLQARWGEYILTRTAGTAGGSVSGNSGRTTAGTTVTVTAITTGNYTWLGWFDGDDRVSEELLYEFEMPYENVTLEARWGDYTVTLIGVGAGEATVTYNANGGTGAPSAQKVTWTNPLVYPVIPPSRATYIFAGWYINSNGGGNPYDFSADIREDITLYAKWLSPTDYTSVIGINQSISGINHSAMVKFFPFVPLASESVTIRTTAVTGDVILCLYNSNKTHLIGCNNVGSAQNESFEYSVTAGTLYYIGVYSAGVNGTCTLNLVGNLPSAGGKAVAGVTLSGAGRVAAGTNKTISAATSLSGYTWLGWYLNDVFVTSETSVDFIMPKSNITYEARWGDYSLTRTAETGGTVSGSSGRITAGTDCTITAATNNGYTFLGWFDGETELSRSLVYEFKMPDGSVTYTAKWMVCPVTVEKTVNDVISAAGGTVSGIEKTILGENTTLTAQTNTDYTWLGWYEGTELITAEASFTVKITDTAKTYTAKWGDYKVNIIRHTIGTLGKTVTFNANGGSGAPTPQTVTLENALTYPSVFPTRSSYVFAGWYDNSECIGTPFDFSADLMQDQTLYAKWIQSSYGVIQLNQSIGDIYLNETERLYGFVPLVSETISLTVTRGSNLLLRFSLRLYNASNGLLTTSTATSSESTRTLTYNVTAGTLYYIGLRDICGYSTGFVSGQYCTLGLNGTIPKDGLARTQGGSVSGAGRFTTGTERIISASTDTGFTWLGWYLNNVFVTSETYVEFTMPKSDITYEARWGDYILTRTATAGGAVSGSSGRFVEGADCTVTAVTYLGYTFLGWFDGGTELSKELTYSFKMPAKSIIYTAKWEKISELTDFTFTSTESILVINKFNNTEATSVVIPDIVTNIENAAFSGCGNLVSITLPFIGSARTAAGSNYALLGYIFGGSNYSGGVAVQQYYTATGNTTYYIPSSLRTVIITDAAQLPYGAFYNCRDLTSISIEGNVTTIGERAFYNCSSLTSMAISDSAISIGSAAFSGCGNLISMTLPFVGANRTAANYNALFGYIFGGNSYVGGVSAQQYYSSTSYVTSYIPSSLKTVTVTDAVQLSYGAFFNCLNLTSITVGNNITNIGERAFYNCSGLISAVIEGETASIGNHAFYGCAKLTSVDVADSVTSIGTYAFYGCAELTSINIPDDVASIEPYTFYGCAKLEEIIIPDNVISIGNNAFYNCSALISITIPENVTSIGNSAFYNCAGLKSVTIQSGLASIGTGAFQDCSSLLSITIPDSVISIGSAAFSGCGSLASITLPFIGTDRAATGTANALFGYIFGSNSYSGGVSTRQYYTSGSYTTYYIPSSLKTVVITGATRLAYGVFYGCADLTSITIPDSVTDIGDAAFSGCTNLSYEIYGNIKYLNNWAIAATSTGVTSANFKATTVGIYYKAFEACANLISVTVPDSVVNIKERAFYNCLNLTSATVGNGATSIGNYAFGYCSSLNLVTIGDSVTTIGNSAFIGCGSLTSITIPDNVETIENSAFYSCSGLNSITIGSGVTLIQGSAFGGTTALTEIYFNATAMQNLSISNNVFNNSGQSGSGITVYVGANVTRIPAYLFNPASSVTYAPQITSVVFETDNSCTGIGAYAFAYCQSLTSINIPLGVTILEISVFSNCSGLTSITIPTAVTSIENSAFYNCSNLTSITVPSGVISIGSSAFAGCSKLESITLPFVGANRTAANSSNAVFGYIFGINNYSGGVSTYQYYASGSSVEYYIPSSLKTVVITNAAQLSYGAFSRCSSLTSITVGGNIPSINGYVFYGCSNLTSVSISDNITSIGTYAFYECQNLPSITIGSGVTSIGTYAFYNTTALTEIYFNATAMQDLPSNNNAVFYNSGRSKSGITVYIGANVTKIPAYLFNPASQTTSAPKITSVIFENNSSCISIGAYAFGYCSNLSSIILGSKLTSIGNYAFCYCLSLTSITIPVSVTTIGGNAFRECTGLTIYAEAGGRPAGWDNSSWNYSNRPVIWGCTLSTDKTYVISFTKSASSILNPMVSNGIAAPYRKGYTFGGWATNSGSSIVAYAAADINNAPDGTTLYAIWL